MEEDQEIKPGLRSSSFLIWVSLHKEGVAVGLNVLQMWFPFPPQEMYREKGVKSSTDMPHSEALDFSPYL